jgi:hypothetical protein
MTKIYNFNAVASFDFKKFKVWGKVLVMGKFNSLKLWNLTLVMKRLNYGFK